MCRDWVGNPMECYSPAFGWLAHDGCYYDEIPAPAPEDQAAWGGSGPGPGAWYSFTCPSVVGTGGGIVWRPTAPSGAGSTSSPAELAQQAVNRLALPKPIIRASPGPEREQLVGLPTWLWVEPGLWAPRSATAAVPGLSVTARGEPTRVTWTMGDGATVVCDGPGTPYRPGRDPAAASPDCGHTYTQSSAHRPDGGFTVSATIAWTVTWSSGEQSGIFPDLYSVSSTEFRVAEAQAVVQASR